SELKYKNIIDYSPIGIYQSGLNGEVIFANNRFAKILGYDSPDEVIKLNFMKDIYANPGIRDMLIDQIKNGNTRYELELHWKKKNGKKIWVRNTIRVNRDADGNILNFEGFIQDISLWKKYETELIKLSKAVEQSSAAIIITDPNGNIEYVNKSFTTITGYSFEEVRNKNPRILKSGKQNDAFYKNLWETILSRKDWKGELQNRRKNGELYWESSIITPITNEKGEIINFVAIKEDISEKKKMIKDLIEAKEKAEEMNRIKTVFFANMSHELRTPFVGIMGYAELLSEILTDPEAKEMADGILNTSIRLTDTLTKILDITQLEYKKIEANRALVNIKRVVEEIYARYIKAAERKNISFSRSINLDNNFIYTDENFLFGILSNLVSNAIKYTKEGSVKIETYKEVDNSKSKLIIRVSDTGIGIEEEKKELIWEEFRQGSEGTTRNYQGCGLGLSIAKKYTEIIGGKIYLESKYGSGSTFILEIPFD
ncbi:MAG: PAS domain S-box protein, partial [Melioribacteraceae bacterium]|nr:PAS domain S-box protein [Melioribacteraceae bacterium]